MRRAKHANVNEEEIEETSSMAASHVEVGPAKKYKRDDDELIDEIVNYLLSI